MENVAVTMKEDNLSLKKNALSAIRQILVAQYDVSEEQACQMIEDSKIEIFFDRNEEIAAHTSYRTWAQRVYEQTRLAEIASRRRKAPHIIMSSEKRA